MLSTIKLLFLCFLGIVLLGGVTPSHAAVRRYRFEVSTSITYFDWYWLIIFSLANDKTLNLLQLRNSTHSRLCTNKTMLTINGQFPGPIIYARRGDLVIVDVINSADHNITIHW